MKFVVTVLGRAQADAELVIEWLADRSPQGATAWGEVYDASIVGLSRDADQHSLAPESAGLERDIWQRFFKTRRGRHYRLLYTIIDNEVCVLRVRGPGQALVTAEDISE